MELRQLEYFITVSELKNFTKAAKVLFVSQPAITKAINSLEDELGIKLFNRSSRKVSLTKEGEVFYNHVGLVMKDIQNARTQMDNLKRNQYGIVKVAVHPLLATSHFFPAYRKFKEKNSSAKIKITTCQYGQVTKMLNDKSFDLAFTLGGKGEYSDSSSKLLVSGYLSLFNNSSIKEVKNISEINKIPLTMVKGDYYFNKIAKDHMLGKSDNIICQAEAIDVIEYMLKSENLKALLPSFIKVSYKSITKIPVTPTIECGIYIIWKDSLTKSVEKEIVTFFSEYYKDLR